jgi:hypothetical protein
MKQSVSRNELEMDNFGAERWVHVLRSYPGQMDTDFPSIVAWHEYGEVRVCPFPDVMEAKTWYDQLGERCAKVLFNKGSYKKVEVPSFGAAYWVDIVRSRLNLTKTELASVLAWYAD